MARAPSKHERDQTLEFQGFLNDLQDWELSLKDKDKKMKAQYPDKGKSSMKVSSSQKIEMIGDDRTSAEKNHAGTKTVNGQYSYSKNIDSIKGISSNFINEESGPDAVSEKELGNEYFKQKKFKEAIECYSRSIALAPTAVAYANRAMAYIKLRRYQTAEEDCTEALNLDDRYIKAYSRRATARKELKNLKGSSEDAEFAMRLEPQNQEIKKQYSEVKALYQKELLEKASKTLKSSAQEEAKTEKSKLKVNGCVQEVSSVSHSSQETAETSIQEDKTKKYQNRSNKQELNPLVQELATRAASIAMAEAAKNMTPPKSAYQFEVSWRALSGDRVNQAQFLKAIPPSALPQIFKNALSAAILTDIIKCLASFFNEEMDLAVKYLENLTKVARFDMIIMCLSFSDKADLRKLWEELFCNKAVPIEYLEALDKLRSRYCPSQ